MRRVNSQIQDPSLAASLHPATGGSRLSERLLDRLPADTVETATIPAGARLEIEAPATEIVLDLQTTRRHPLAAETMADAVSLWRGETLVTTVPVSAPGRVTVVVPITQPGRHTIYLPDVVRARVTSVTCDVALRRVAPGPRWIAYGDSITQGWSASDPGRTYVATVSRTLGLEPVNLGFSGSARGEVLVAEHIAAQEAAVITLAFGTNNWSRIPSGRLKIAGVLEDFITMIRSGHPTTPIVVLSPIVRPDAEQTRNAVGATLAELRRSIEDIVRELGASDNGLWLVPGLGIVNPANLVDGVHPGDAGHASIADALTPHLAQALARNRAQGVAS